jgi:hypothetical protein
MDEFIRLLAGGSFHGCAKTTETTWSTLQRCGSTHGGTFVG